MPEIEHNAFFEAPPEQVFALIRRVDEFSRYADAVESVQDLGNARYRWHVKVPGQTFCWDIEIIECIEPERIVWRSLTGIPNTGRYRITPAGRGTRVNLVIAYHLSNPLLDKTLGRIVTPVVRTIGDQALQRMRMRLKQDNM